MRIAILLIASPLRELTAVWDPRCVISWGSQQCW